MRLRMYNIAKKSLAVTLIALVCSCSTTRYTPVEMDTANLYRIEEAESDSSTIARIPWDQFFTDDYLRQLIKTGIDNNLDLGIAEQRVRSAQATLRMARQSFFPSISLTAGVNETLSSNGNEGKKVFGYSSPEYSFGVGAGWEMDLWGKLAAQSRAEHAALALSVEYRELVRTQLISGIASSYYTLLALDKQLEITRMTARLLEQSAQVMEELMQAGMLTGAAVQQSIALYYSTLVTIPDIEINIRQTENSLSVLLGTAPDTVYRSTLEQQRFYPAMDYGVPMQLLAYRPDVRQAELSFRRAFELVQVARASFYPSLSLGSGSFAGWGSSRLPGIFKPENLLAQIIGQVTLPIFARGQLRANLEIADASRQEALLTFYKTMLSAAQEVSDIVYGFRQSRDKNPVRELQIEALETAVYFTGELLIAGEANYTEVLTAQQNLLAARLSQVNDILEQLQYGVDLYRALGGGSMSSATGGHNYAD